MKPASSLRVAIPAVWRYPHRLALALASSVWTLSAAAQPASVPQVATPGAITIPDTHRQVGQRSVSMNGKPVVLTRYERRDGRNAGLDGEHLSTVVAPDGRLLGFAHIALDLMDKPLPSRERSEQIARGFLREAAPDLLPSMRVTSIAPHDESVRVSRGGRSETVQLSGMKLKARNTADGSWFWVIVGGDEKPMLFERDLEWSNLRFRRGTEEWLHDRWIREREGRRTGAPIG